MLNYLLGTHKKTLINIMRDPSDQHFSLPINFGELFDENPTLGYLLLNKPYDGLKQCDKSLIEAQSIILTENNDADLVIKTTIHARIIGLPFGPKSHKSGLPRNGDLGKFLKVSGVVARTSCVKILQFKKNFTCSRCKQSLTVEAEYSEKYLITPPSECNECKGVNFVAVEELNGDFCKDYQEIVLQEDVNKLDIATMPNCIVVTVEDDLADLCKPGDNITVSGIVERRWNSLTLGKRIEVELTINANYIQIHNDASAFTAITSDIKQRLDIFWNKYREIELYGRDLILRSFLPEIYGMYMVKLAVATILAGGSETVSENEKKSGTHTRSKPHLMLIGDAGTGKSQFLRFAAKVVPRSVLTTGVGSTSAGLTAAAVKEGGEWQLEGGALVLADGGICCIDEFCTLKEHDRTSIYEAMEQQSIHVAKGGIVRKLNTRCSIVAASNPKVPLDSHQPLTSISGLSSPLLSRFDLILILKDKMNPEWDNRASDYILNGFKNKSKFIEERASFWSMDLLQAYFVYIKRINPLLTEKAKEILVTYYQYRRRSAYRSKAQTTVRLFDSLIRLSQGHARLMCHQNVEVVDAITAIVLIESSADTSESDDDSNENSKYFDAQADFPGEPIEKYTKYKKDILGKLHLNEENFPDKLSIDNLYNSTTDVPVLHNDTQPFNNKEDHYKSDEHETLETRNNDLRSLENMKENVSTSINDFRILEHRDIDNESINYSPKYDGANTENRNSNISSGELNAEIQINSTETKEKLISSECGNSFEQCDAAFSPQRCKTQDSPKSNNGNKVVRKRPYKFGNKNKKLKLCSNVSSEVKQNISDFNVPSGNVANSQKLCTKSQSTQNLAIVHDKSIFECDNLDEIDLDL